MYTYSAVQWLFFFYFYCVAGWCFESTYVSIRKRRLVNRGFMKGPCLPLYGSGAILLLFVTLPVRENLLLTFLFGSIAATALEYVTGVVMEALFKIRYWDYSDQRFQFQGHICLSSSLAWGALAIVLTRVLHAPVERLTLAIPEKILTVCLFPVTILAAADFTLSVKAALDLRDVLVKFEKAKRELELLQKRLDVIAAYAEDAAEKRKKERSQRLEELFASLETRFQKTRNNRGNSTVTEELAELRERYAELKCRREQLREVRGIHKRHLLLNHPSMRSERFKEALELLKKSAAERSRKEEREDSGDREEG